MGISIDLNADCGESYGHWRLGDDASILGVVTSANIACGMHAGDPSVMRRTCALAAENRVKIGAHVSYPDLLGFGRRYMDIAPHELTDSVLYQMGALETMARISGSNISYIKPHGGLYNAIVHDAKQAKAVLNALVEYGKNLPILCLPHSQVSYIAEDMGIPVVLEAFADRAYSSEGTLVPRGVEGAVISDSEQVIERVLKMVTEREITSIDGKNIEFSAHSICVHGDTAGAVELAQKIRSALDKADIAVASFLS